MKPTEIEALRAGYVGNRQQLYTYAVSITRNRETAEDAIQGVFERLLRGTCLPAELRPYLVRAVRNAAFDARRRAKVRADSMFEAGGKERDESSRSVAFHPDEIDDLLQQLSPDEREAIVLKLYGDLTFQQIADVRQVPLPTVASWYRRGLDQLKTLLTAER